MSLQEKYDDAMFEFSKAEYDNAIAKLEEILREDPSHFDAQLSLGMAYFRKGNYARAIEEGHKAQKLRPNEQLVHTNLSLCYMRAGDKATAEHHGLQARIASWKTPAAGAPEQKIDSELELAKPPPPKPLPAELANAPWRKKQVIPTKPKTDE